MPISELHWRCINFGQNVGLPAVTYSWDAIVKLHQYYIDNYLVDNSTGTPQPGKGMFNVEGPTSITEYSLLVRDFTVRPKARNVTPPAPETTAELVFDFIATVWRKADPIKGTPATKIRDYRISNEVAADGIKIPAIIQLADANQASLPTLLAWKLVTPHRVEIEKLNWYLDENNDLDDLGFIDPEGVLTPLEYYKQEVELTMKVDHRKYFARILVSLLPPLDYAEAAPWLRLDPKELMIDHAEGAVIITGRKGHSEMKGECCEKIIVPFEPDPNFPNVADVPPPDIVGTAPGKGNVCVFVPENRINEIYAKGLSETVPISYKGNGQIYAEMDGKLGLEPIQGRAFADIRSGIRSRGFLDIKGKIKTIGARARGCSKTWDVDFLGIQFEGPSICTGYSPFSAECKFVGTAELIKDQFETNVMIHMDVRRSHMFITYGGGDVADLIISYLDGGYVQSLAARAAFFSDQIMVGRVKGLFQAYPSYFFGATAEGVRLNDDSRGVSLLIGTVSEDRGLDTKLYQ